jgi:flavin-dependent dehydrogenase
VQTHYDAIIVGGGPAGATAAIRLTQAGWSVALVERDAFPRRKVCGECIAASNLPLLEALGVGESFAALAGPALRRVAVLCGRERISAALPAASDARQPWGRALGRAQLDALLLARAQALGATLWQPWTAQSLRGSPGAYCCELRPARMAAAARIARDAAAHADADAPITLTAPVAIAAYGSWQPLPAERASAHRGAHGRELLAFKANFIDSQLEPGLLPVLAFAGGYGGMVLADGGAMTLACCIQLSALQRARRANPGLSAGEAVQAYLQQHCQGVADALRGARRSGEWLAAGPIRPVTGPAPAAVTATAKATATATATAAETLPALPPFRIGNAAGEAHPLIGEGISMALQSAWLLCNLLMEHPQARGNGRAALEAQRALHEHYRAQWRRQFLGRMRLAATLAQLAMHPRATRSLLPLLRRAPGLLTHGARWSGKIRAIGTHLQEVTS